MSRILSAHAFYKNDVPGGIGLSYEFHTTEAGEQFEQWLWEVAKRWDANADADDLFNQLAEMGAMGKGTLSEAEKQVAFVNIFWLEQRGHLKPDDFNGCAFAIEETDGTTQRIRPARERNRMAFLRHRRR